jgi:predicted nucleotidyltransferase
MPRTTSNGGLGKIERGRQGGNEEVVMARRARDTTRGAGKLPAVTGAHLLSASIDEVGRDFGLSELYVFGSRAQEIAARVRGEPVDARALKSASDVDVGARPVPGTSLDMKAIVDLQVRLEELLDVRRVDVVVLPDVNPYLALDVIRGELLFCSDADEQAEFELEVLRRAGDLAPFQRLRQEMALSRYG